MNKRKVDQLRLTPLARDDLENIWTYTAEHWSIKQADQYIASLDMAFQRLAEVPELMRLRMEFEPPMRIYPHRSHIIIYTVSGRDLVIIRVRHGHEDWSLDPAGIGPEGEIK
ncbi:MAG: type II toxin-antitoxin system RelE/ParE family toxin [Hyphomonadaceae bacterium]